MIHEGTRRNTKPEDLDTDSTDLKDLQNNTLEKGILEERVLPAFAEVTNGDDPSYKMHVDQIYGDD
jgi:hypothetical protein